MLPNLTMLPNLKMLVFASIAHMPFWHGMAVVLKLIFAALLAVVLTLIFPDSCEKNGKIRGRCACGTLLVSAGPPGRSVSPSREHFRRLGRHEHQWLTVFLRRWWGTVNLPLPTVTSFSARSVEGQRMSCMPGCR
jgi:hypothetical protein